MGKLIVGVAVGLVIVVLATGIYTFWVGGDVSMTWSNRIMRIRVLAQFVAIVIILIVLAYSGHH